jgi:8-oxo-dGTP diphosphatase
VSAREPFQSSRILLPRTSYSFDPSHAATALILLADGRFLLQHRDRIDGILYPGFWGCFGGAKDRDESGEDALRRELKEELGLVLGRAEYFTAVNFDFRFCGKGIMLREYYTVSIDDAVLDTLVLGEGQGMAALTAAEILALDDMIPFDQFAHWLYVNRNALSR